MRGWGWIGGAVVVLVGATLTAGMVGAPRPTTPEVMSAPRAVRAEARVARTADAAHARAEVRSEQPERPAVRAELLRELGDGLADEIERQRSAMRAAVVLLVAGEETRARSR